MTGVKRAARIVDLGLTDYAAAYGLQLDLVEKRRNGVGADDIFLVTNILVRSPWAGGVAARI